VICESRISQSGDRAFIILLNEQILELAHVEDGSSR
jgi:hypothetical protein